MTGTTTAAPPVPAFASTLTFFGDFDTDVEVDALLVLLLVSVTDFGDASTAAIFLLVFFDEDGLDGGTAAASAAFDFVGFSSFKTGFSASSISASLSSSSSFTGFSSFFFFFLSSSLSLSDFEVFFSATLSSSSSSSSSTSSLTSSSLSFCSDSDVFFSVFFSSSSEEAALPVLAALVVSFLFSSSAVSVMVVWFLDCWS
mmetsp:Transcript_52353/g.126647  ORF Transcript_52353/g.126647 Transcript_52353/m.126647 type:complete len:200 (-) Transcript_52353:214-813(-)